MSLENFQTEDTETIGKLIILRAFSKVYHEQAANLNDSCENIEFVIEENNKYHQIGNSYLQYEIIIEKKAANAAD